MMFSTSAARTQAVPAFVFELLAETRAHFGLLYLPHGRSENKRIVPETWVDESSHANERIELCGVDAGGL
jgi:hypothetical protein